MDREQREKIFAFAKLIGSCKQDELNEMFQMSEADWHRHMEDVERGISYPEWIRTVAAVSNMNEECKNWLNEEEFWRAYRIS